MNDLSAMSDADLLAKLGKAPAPVADLSGMSDAELLSKLGRTQMPEVDSMGNPTGGMTVVPTDPKMSYGDQMRKVGGVVDDGVRMVANGATFGMADRVAAAGNAALGDKTYDDELKAERARTQAVRTASPVAAGVAEAAGGMLTGAGMMKNGLTLLKPGMGLPTAIGAGAAEGAAYGAAHGAGNADGDYTNAAQQGALTGAVIGGAVPIAGRALSAMFGSKPPTVAAPTMEEIQAAKTAAYKSAEDAGAVYSPQAVSRIKDNITKSLTEIGYDPALQPGAAVAVKRIADMEGQNVTLTGLDTLRKIASNGFVPGNRSNNRAIADIIRSIDDVATAPQAGEVLVGDAVKAAGALKEGRSLASREAKATRLSDALYAAELRTAATGSGGNLDNASRQRVADMLKPGKDRGFTADEREALEQIVKGTRPQNLARLIGKLSPNGNGLMLAGNLVAAGQSGGASLPIAALGAGAKTYADGATMRNVALAEELIRSGGVKPKTSGVDQQRLEALSRALLMGGAETQSPNVRLPSVAR